MPAANRKLKTQPVRDNVISFPVTNIKTNFFFEQKEKNRALKGHYRTMEILGLECSVWDIEPNDIALVLKRFTVRELTFGKIVLVYIPGTDVRTLKKIVGVNNGVLTLRGANEISPDVEIDAGDPDIEGIITGIQRNFN